MPDIEMTDEELEDELAKTLKENEPKKDNCGTAIPGNKEVGIQRTDVKIKKE
jgi:hypothetical protein